MGKAVYACTLESDDFEIVAGIDIAAPESCDCGFPVYRLFTRIPQELVEKADIIIDFSNPSALGGLLEFAAAHSLPALVATTGLNEAQVALLKTAAKRIPVFFTANMSLGVNLLCELAKKAAKALGADFDIEIIEMHHNQKLDAPSGTALMLADAVSSELENEVDYEYNRHDKREKRPKNEIGIHSVRGGTIVGEHQVIFAGNDETITLSHSARSKALFATGAINAARFLIRQQPGFYSMADVIE